MEIELIKDIEPTGKYNKSGIVNHLSFTVEGGRMILFYGPNRELLQLIERAKD
ncbi:hypothetical protein [Peribacillus butanolivorans]|uniref:hypothetical protein n=1 Tax=Peribacillus butanolivorans TaxID=421767 RepID=UPI0036D967AF